MSDSSSKPFVCKRRATHGAMVLARRLGVTSIGGLAKLEADDIESLLSCVSGARYLVDRLPMAADLDLTVFEEQS